MPNKRSSLLAASGLVGAAVLMSATTPLAAMAQETEVEELVVTGSRLQDGEFTSASPVQVLNPKSAQLRGVADTAQFLHNAPSVASSSQVNAAASTALPEDGGPGAATLSLRGLGPTRTLVLINGRRVGPAGTRGAVSSVDLNTIPQSAIERVDILKDGASSIYGSDAVAGVVNVITRRQTDGGEVSAFYSAPFEGGGEVLNLAGDWGRTFDRGWVHVSADYYRQEQLRQGDRDYTRCAEQYVFDPATGARSDVIDPRTGQPACRDHDWGQIYIFAINSLSPLDFTQREGRLQYDFDGDLGDYIVPMPPALASQYPSTFPEGFFLVGQDAQSLGLANANHPLDDAQSLIPQTDRQTVFLEGGFDLTAQMEAYGEVLLSRRETHKDGFRQFWPTNFTENFLAPGFGDPFAPGFSGLYALQPTIGTGHADIDTQVDYVRLVGGVRGTLPGPGFAGWKWDIFAQHSRSDGSYSFDQVLNDAIDSQSLRFGSCEGATLPVSGRPCMDISFTDPRVLGGDFTEAEAAFLFDRETGNTVYTQSFVEGSVSGTAAQLPAGPLGLAVGFHLRKDEIRDTPGHITLADNAWGRSGAGITQGSDVTGEFFAEAGVPLLRDAPLAQRADLTLSTRWTDVESSGSAVTYKAGLNWAFTPEYRLRSTWGTSFRAPALFELYLANQTSFLTPAFIDPCVQWEARLFFNLISQQVADNCASPAGPGGAIPGDLPGLGATLLVQEGGRGRLRPETSEAVTLGFVWTPAFTPLKVAVDYFDIEIENGVTLLAEQTVLACYSSPNFPTDPVCGLLDRDPITQEVSEIRSSYINIAEQRSRGVDLAVSYVRELPWNLDLGLDGQFTWQLEDERELFAGNLDDFNGDIGEPSFVGAVNLTLRRGPWTAGWVADLIGHQSNYASYGGDEVLVFDEPQRVKAHAEFTAFHTASVQYDGSGWSALVGVANLFDEHPPAVTTVGSGLGEYSTVGVSAFTSQYTEGYYGRRGFVRVSKSF